MDLLNEVGALLTQLVLTPSPRQLLQIPFLASLTISPQSNQPQHALTSGPACRHAELSCPAQLPPDFDECCLNAPSGHFLSTQFWDTAPVLGANDTWTLHGLWPDYCAGGFEQYCDDARSLSQDEIERILESASKSTHPGLLSFMQEHWLSFDQRNSHLWTHEWNKHGTCISTLKPKCYGDYDTVSSVGYNGLASSSSSSSSPRDVLDYFQRATSLYSSLDTFKTLAEHNITPSYDITYALSDIQAAIKTSSHGHDVTLKCNSRHELQEVWYHFLVRGSLRDADPSSSPANSASIFVPTDADGQISNCPATGVKYIPKGPPSSRPGYPSPPPPGGPNPTPFEGRGHLKIHVLSSDGDDSEMAQTSPQKDSSVFQQSEDYQGCLIRAGVWYISGACATYTAKTDVQELPNKDSALQASANDDNDAEDHLFTLQSSFAPCAVLEKTDRHGIQGQFVCARHLPVQSIFSAANSSETSVEFVDGGAADKVLSYKGRTVFYADRLPGRFEKVSLFADDGDGERSVKVEVHWESS